MPDSFVPYPSPTWSGGSPASTQAVDPARLSVASATADHPQAEWASDPLFEAMYSTMDPLPAMTEAEMAALLELETFVDFAPPEPLFPPVPTENGQMNLFSTNPQVTPFNAFGSNLPLQPEPALQSPVDSQPRRLPPPLPQLTFDPSFTPPTPPYTARPYQLYQPGPFQPQHQQQQQLPLFQPPILQMNPIRRREPERMALPTPGDLDVSMCEVIM
ncbi:hypothetical protein FRC09_015925 [Ceratobasidium sp. 395]|nr:hypothetical protein FRC09_015925 [Ceratobasidium sp. 395]